MENIINAIENLLKKTVGKTCVVTGYNQISKRAAIVARISLKNAPWESVIAKHVFEEAFPANNLPTAHHEFAEELLAYKFLAKSGTKEKFSPNLIAFDNRGIFIQEDLGSEPFKEMRTFEYLVPRLAHAIAHLHASAFHEEASYLKLRKECGLGTPDEDKRRYGKPSQDKRFELGRDYILQQIKIKYSNYDPASIFNELNNVFQHIAEPGNFKTFIHDDLGNARQTFECGDELVLLDFEYSKFTHALLDFVKPVIGKFELDLTNGNYLWNNPAFPVEITSHYRSYLSEKHQILYDDSEWDQGLNAALVYGAVALIGRLMHLEKDRKLVGTVQQNINGILYCLSQVLPSKKHCPLLCGFIDVYLDIKAYQRLVH